MSKINKISGFPEWLPEQKLVEDRVIATIRRVYANYGFTPLETPSAELVSTLQSKGVIDKEIYLLKRAKQEEGKEKDESELALHFDLTVPFARYVAQHFSALKFPFKRYQLQKVWRGERPQKGRFREFYQFDIDTIAQEDLPLACDAEVLSAINDVFSELALGPFKIRINSRKILLGIYQSLGLNAEQKKAVITAVDKIDKIGEGGVEKELSTLGLNEKTIRAILDAAKIRLTPANMDDELSRLNIADEGFTAGVAELSRIASLAGEAARKNFVIDLSLARGLDYYTGLITEVVLDDHPEFGSVCSGGRYEDLASQFINKKLPGVGVSIGLTRLMDLIFSANLLPLGGTAPSRVLVAVYNEEQRAQCNDAARTLRKNGIAAEVYYKSPKLGKQIDYAAERGIPYVLFISETGDIEVKDLATKTQTPVKNLDSWAQELSRETI